MKEDHKDVEPVEEVTETEVETVEESEPEAVEETVEPTEETVEEVETESEEEVETESEEPVEEVKEELNSDPVSAVKAELGKYVSEFGAEKGTEWFLSGREFAECQSDMIRQLSAQLQETQKKLTGALSAAGEDSPVSVVPAVGKSVATSNYDRIKDGIKFAS